MGRVGLLCLLLGVLLLPTRMFGQGQTGISLATVTTTDFPKLTMLVHTPPAQAGNAPVPEVRLKGQLLPLTALERVKQPVAVSVVADLSDGMRPELASGVTRLDAMQQRLSELIWQFQPEQPSMSLILITDTVEVALVHETNLIAVGNTVANGNTAFPFALMIRDQAAPPVGTLIQAALARGLAQLATADPAVPQVLVLFASSDAWQATDLLTLQPALEAARREHPLEVLIVGFGGDADKNALKTAALQLGATYIHQSDLGSVPQKTALYAAYRTLTTLGHFTRLSVVADGVPAGKATLRVTLGTDGAERELEVPPHAPVVTPRLAANQLQDTVLMGFNPTFAQTPLKTVNYLLNGQSLSSFGVAQADFILQVDTATAAFQQLYPPNQAYELVVAVTDEQNLESRSTPVMVTVLPPTAVPPPWRLILTGCVIVLVIVVVVVWLRIVRLPRPNGARAKVPEKATPAQGEAGKDAPGVTLPQQRPPELPTEPQGDRGGRPPGGSGAPPTKPVARPPAVYQWRLEFLEGVELPPVVLSVARGTRYGIGRPDENVEQDALYIAVSNPYVTRGAHATLILMGDGAQLRLQVNKAMNPIYRGLNQEEELPSGQEVPLASGDIFWLSSTVKICVTREG